jgi:hypothetical protein
VTLFIRVKKKTPKENKLMKKFLYKKMETVLDDIQEEIVK